MKQIITKNGRVYASASTPYPPEVVKQMREAGYKVKEIKDERGKQSDT